MSTFAERIDHLLELVGSGDLTGKVEVSQVYAKYQLRGMNASTLGILAAARPSTCASRCSATTASIWSAMPAQCSTTAASLRSSPRWRISRKRAASPPMPQSCTPTCGPPGTRLWSRQARRSMTGHHASTGSARKNCGPSTGSTTRRGLTRQGGNSGAGSDGNGKVTTG